MTSVVYEVFADEGLYEVLVLGAECAEFGDAGVFFVQAPVDVLGVAGGAAVLVFWTLTRRSVQPSGRRRW